MPNADKFSFVDEDNTRVVEEAILGISGVSGITRRGPVGDPSILIKSESEFLKLYGNEIEGNDFIDLCLRHLRMGGQLRVNRIVHYTDVSDKSTSTAVKATDLTIQNNSDPKQDLLTVSAKYPGADYNQMKIQTKNGSNGKPNYFDLLVWIETDKTRTLETYTNLLINDKTLNDPTRDTLLLQRVNSNSKLISIAKASTYPVTPTSITPFMSTQTFTGGSNGGTVVPADYAGDSAGQTGFYAFDPFDDMMQVAVPTIFDAAVNSAGAVYAEGRQDLFFFGHLQAQADENDIITAKNQITGLTKYTQLFVGDVIVRNPSNQLSQQLSEVGDMLTLAVKVDKNFGPWFSMAGLNRGVISDAQNVGVNFGGDGNYEKLNLLANAQINAVVAKKGKVYNSGNFTAQEEPSKASYANIVRLLIYLKKSLGPTIERYLEEPLDIPTFIALADEVEPFLESIKSGRGLYAYKWDGDQNVGNINDVRINNLDDIDQGIYRVHLALEPINAIGEIIVGISLNKTGTISMDVISDTTATF